MSGENRDLIWLLVVFVLLIGILPMLIWRPLDGYMHGMVGMMGYGWGFMWLIPMAFVLLAAVGVYYLVTGSTRTGRPQTSQGERALEILKERYARGEITSEQYAKMKEELEQ